MKKLHTAYTFNPGPSNVGTVVLSNKIYTIEQILLITNISTGQIIYQFNDITKGATLSTGSGHTTLALATDTSAQSNTNKLQIFVEESRVTRNSQALGTTIFSYAVNLANNTTVEPAGSPPLVWDLSSSSSRHLFANFHLTGQWAATPTGTGNLVIWLLPEREPDSSSYPDGSSTFTPLVSPQLIFPIAAVTTVQNIGLDLKLRLAPVRYKLVIRNEAGSQANNATTALTLRSVLWGLEDT